MPSVIASTNYVAALSEMVAPMARGLPLQLLKMPLTFEAAVRLIWHERTGTSPAHAWLRGVVEEVGRESKRRARSISGLKMA